VDGRVVFSGVVHGDLRSPRTTPRDQLTDLYETVYERNADCIVFTVSYFSRSNNTNSAVLRIFEVGTT
jgi:hypothetical protein